MKFSDRPVGSVEKSVSMRGERAVEHPVNIDYMSIKIYVLGAKRH